MVRDQSLKENDKIGPYTVRRLIGTGGMGEVYEAYDEVLGRRVALKIISPRFERDTEIIRRFESEGRALARVNHTHVVSVYSQGEHAGILYLAMEYVEGRTLDQCIRDKGSFRVTEAVPLFFQMLDGLSALHANGIIHRDLKPKNIIVRPDNSIKIVDFGVAKDFSEAALEITHAGTLVGSVQYCSPEMAKGEPASTQSDIWAMGAIFYEMLVGEKAFTAESVLATIDRIKSAPLGFPMGSKIWIPAGLRELILKMCAKSTAFRFRDIAEIQKELLDLSEVAGIDIDGTRTSAAKRAVQGKERSSRSGSQSSFRTRSGKARHGSPGSIWKILLLGFSFGLLIAVSWWPRTPVRVERTPASRPPRNEVELVKPKPEAPPPVEMPRAKPEERPAPAIEPSVEEIPKREAAKVAAPRSRERGRKKAQPVKPKLSAPEILSRRLEVELSFQVSPRTPAAEGAARIKNPPKLAWRPVRGAKGYDIEIANSPRFSPLVEARHVRSAFLTWDSARPGSFHWRVRAVGETGEGPFSAGAQMRVSLPPPKLEASYFRTIETKSPQEYVQSSPAFTIEWKDLPLAEAYEVSISQDAKSFRPLISRTVDEAKARLRLKKGGEYWVRVAAVDKGGRRVSSLSAAAPLHLEKVLILQMPTPLVPRDGSVFSGARNQTVPLVFGWSAVPQAEYYEIQLAWDRNFSALLYSKRLKDNQFSFSSRLDREVLYWRVRAGWKSFQSAWTRSQFIQRQ